MDRIKTILVGCGAMSSAWLKVLTEHPEVNLVALVDLDEAVARQRAQTTGIEQIRIGTDLEAMIAETGAEWVCDCTVPAAHKTVTLTAIEAGCHVLGEKPISDNLFDARTMVAAAEAAGKHYAVIQNRRYLPGIRQVRQALADGLIGEISAIHADFFRGPRFGGFREEMRHVLLVDMAIHSFDQARFLSGLDARHVNCHESNPPESWFAHGASATAIFEMENQAVFTYRGSWVAQGLPTNWECAWRILGSRGTLLWDGADEIRLATVPRGAPAGENSAELIDVPSRAWDPADNGHAGVIREFIRCLRTGETPLTHGRDNLKSLAMVFAAVESAESHAWVEVAG